MRNPFRNEGDAVRIVVMIVVAGAIVIASALLISSTVGAVLALVAILIGAWATVGWLRVALSARDEEPSPGPPSGSGEDGPGGFGR
jgi:hypothetical protein